MELIPRGIDMRLTGNFSWRVLFTVFVLVQTTNARDISPTENHYLGLLNEFKARRTTVAAMPNPVGLDSGPVVGFIDLKTGKPSLVQDDLKVAGHPSALLRRIYAPIEHATRELSQNAERSSRWRFSFQHTAERTNRGYLVRLSNGATLEFVKSGRSGFKTVGYNPFFRASLAKLGEAGLMLALSGRITVHFVSNEPGRFVVSQWTHGTRTYKVSYENSNLSSISEARSGEEIVRFSKTGPKLVATSMLDGTTVAYTYDSRGRLKSVSQSDGFDFDFGYQNDLLSRVQYSRHSPILLFKYGNDGRVRESQSAQGDFKYQYDIDQTSVSERGGKELVVKYGGNGLIESYARNNTIKYVFRYQDFELVELVRNDVPVLHIDHSSVEPLRVEIFGESHLISFDNAGDIARIETDGGNTLFSRNRGGVSVQATPDRNNFDFVLGSNGRVTGLKVAGELYGVRESPITGKLAGLFSSSGEGVGLGYDRSGNLAAAYFPDGGETNYSYNDKGLRASTEYSGVIPRTVQFRYDAGGSLVETRSFENGEEIGGHRLQLGPWSRVSRIDYFDGAVMKLRYDTHGRVRHIHLDSGQVEYRYDDAGRVEKMSTPNESFNYTYSPGQQDVSRLTDTRTNRITAGLETFFYPTTRVSQDFQPSVGVHTFVNFDQEFFTFDVTPLAMLPEVSEWRSLANVIRQTSISKLAGGSVAERSNFEKASNVLLKPKRLFSVNCCGPCPYSPNQCALLGGDTWCNGISEGDPICSTPVRGGGVSNTLNSMGSSNFIVKSDGSYTVGLTTISGIAENTSCKAICVANSIVYRTEGNAYATISPRFAFNWRESPSSPSVATSTAVRDDSKVHELIHVNNWDSWFLNYNTGLWQDPWFASAAACNNYLNNYFANFNSEIDDKVEDEKCHRVGFGSLMGWNYINGWVYEVPFPNC